MAALLGKANSARRKSTGLDNTKAVLDRLHADMYLVHVENQAALCMSALMKATMPLWDAMNRDWHVDDGRRTIARLKKSLPETQLALKDAFAGVFKSVRPTVLAPWSVDVQVLMKLYYPD